jgi:beta-glucanase (GH16 family)
MVKHVIGFIGVLLILLSCSPVETVMSIEDGYELVWQDEFSGWSLDDEKWALTLGGHGFGNRELQYYTNESSNLKVRNGKLTITARREKYQGNLYTSAKIWTLDRAAFKYGIITARMKLPKGQGIWPAFWMLPKDPYEVRWPASGEIDIMELVGHLPNEVHGTLHFGEPHEFHGGKYVLPRGDFSEDFHEFSVKWEENKITWYVDGKPYYSREQWFSNDLYNRNEYEYPAPFDKEFMLILNVAVGGEWPGNPNDTTEFPQKMEVDFVRVYQKTQ